ncbi:MAG: tetratricopeptide repeat protein [Myxococcota bacterium]|nr:tetratricopeptide repeat protein [Myxococcota bacterium]MDW8362183.1 tetratricopeptide repeat protein [Myxococcales bacterium]
MCAVLALGFAVSAVVAQRPDQSHGTAPSVDESRDREARALFEAGSAAYDRGRYAEALEHFRRAHALSGRARLLFNIGLAAERLGRDAEALEAYEAYLSAEPAGDNRLDVQARVGALRNRIAARALEQERRDAERRRREGLEEEQRGVELEGRIEELERRSEEQRGGGVFGRWWFWAAVGGAVAAGVVAAVLLSREEPQPDYLVGDGGSIAFTLRWP